MSQKIKFFLLSTVLITPIAIPARNLGFEQVKVLIFIVLMTLSGCLWLLSRPKIKLSPVNKASLVFILILAITSLTGIDLKNSFLGQHPYYQGLILYSELFLFSIMVSQIGIKTQTWFNLLMISAVVVSAIAIKEAQAAYLFNTPLATYAGRVVSTFGQPNFYSGWILLSLPVFYDVIRRKKDWKYQVGFLICILAIILSYSKTAIFLTGGLIFIWLSQSFARAWKAVIILTILTLVIAVGASIRFQQGLVWDQLGRADQNYEIVKYSPETRAYIWPTVLDLIYKKPILGYGLENLRDVFGTNIRLEEAKTAYAADLKNLIIDRSHSYILDLLVSGGLVALISWLILVSLILKRAKGAILTGLLVYLFWIQFQNQSVVHLIYFWLIVGLVDQEVHL